MAHTESTGSKRESFHGPRRARVNRRGGFRAERIACAALRARGDRVGAGGAGYAEAWAAARETGAATIACYASRAEEVERLFAELDKTGDRLDLVVYNPSARARRPVTELDAVAVQHAIMVTTFGGFLVAQAAAQRMLKQGYGTILFTGASASVKGYPRSSSFAMGKFALHGPARASRANCSRTTSISMSGTS